MSFEPPIHWNDYEDIAMKLYERFGDDFTESKDLPHPVYRPAQMGAGNPELRGQGGRK